METGSKLSKVTPKFWNTRYGVINAVPDDNMVARSLDRYGEWAESELDLLSGVLQEGSTALQVGAEYGVHALWLAQTLGPEGEVHVFEPNRLGHLQLCANAALNGVVNIYGYVTGAEAKRDISVDALNLPGLQLIKVNPTGTLLSILGGASDTIRKLKPYLYFRVGSPELAVAEVAAVKKLGYRCWSHVAYLYNPANATGNASDMFAGWAHQNVIAAPIESGVEFDDLREI